MCVCVCACAGSFILKVEVLADRFFCHSYVRWRISENCGGACTVAVPQVIIGNESIPLYSEATMESLGQSYILPMCMSCEGIRMVRHSYITSHAFPHGKSQ